MNLIFKYGDMIIIGNTHKQKAQIVNFRTELITPGARYEKYGCDVLVEDGDVRFYPLVDLARWNINKVKDGFQ